MEKVMREEHVLQLRVMKIVAGIEFRRCGRGVPATVQFFLLLPPQNIILPWPYHTHQDAHPVVNIHENIVRHTRVS
jgi:hypothetical protein